MKRLLLAPLLIALAGCSNESDQWTTYHQTNTRNKYNCRGGGIYQINLKNIKQSSEGIIYDHRNFSFREEPCVKPSRVFKKPETTIKTSIIKKERILSNCLAKTHWIENYRRPGEGTAYKYTNSGWLRYNDGRNVFRISSGEFQGRWEDLSSDFDKDGKDKEMKETRLSKLLRAVCIKSNRNLQ